MGVVCAILVFVSVNDLGGIPFQVKTNIEGKILKEGDTKYLVDFTKGVSKNKKITNPNDYKNVLVDKNECVKL